jgi:Flp pilus assembly protein TadG
MKVVRAAAQAIVEFALVFPVVLLVFVGIFELGRLMIEYSSIANAAREATRVGIITAVNATQITTTAQNMAITAGAPAVVITVTSGLTPVPVAVDSRQSGDTITVTVSHSFVPIGFVGMGSSIPISSSAGMQVE